MDPGDVAWDSGPDGGTADDVAFSVSERSDADDVVLAVLALALDRAARVSHAPTDAPVAETKVPVLVQLRSFEEKSYSAEIAEAELTCLSLPS